MKKRFIAYLDILGFKDLVKNNSLENLLKIYSDAFKIAYENVKNIVRIDNGYHEGNLKTQIISDSIIIWSESDTYNGGAILIEFTCFLMYSFTHAGMPLRGGIVYDEIDTLTFGTVESNVILGNGLVKAYELEGKQNMVSCIVDLFCLQHLEYLSEEVLREYPHQKNNLFTLSKMLEIELLIEYQTPCKKGKEMHYLLNWPRRRDKKPTLDFLKNSFSAHNKGTDNPTVIEKIMNTHDFVEYSWRNII